MHIEYTLSEQDYRDAIFANRKSRFASRWMIRFANFLAALILLFLLLAFIGSRGQSRAFFVDLMPLATSAVFGA